MRTWFVGVRTEGSGLVDNSEVEVKAETAEEAQRKVSKQLKGPGSYTTGVRENYKKDLPKMKDNIIVQHTLEVIHNRWPDHEVGPYWFDIICRLNGWCPLDKGAKMTLHENGKEFVVTRTK